MPNPNGSLSVDDMNAILNPGQSNVKGPEGSLSIDDVNNQLAGNNPDGSNSMTGTEANPDKESAGTAFVRHGANAVLGDFGPRMAGTVYSILHPSEPKASERGKEHWQKASDYENKNYSKSSTLG